MNKQDNRLALSVVATLISGISLIYTMIMFPQIIFAVAGIGLIFIISAFILTQNILSYASYKDKSLNSQIRECVNQITNQIETTQNFHSQLGKATFIYTKQITQTLSTLENNYIESQEALYKNLTALSNAQNKSTKLMIKYDQGNTTKIISTLKDLRNQLSDTMIQGFDQIQPNNEEIVNTLEEIVNYLKTRSTSMDQSMGLQLNNVAHELQNISSSIQRVQIAMPQTSVASVMQSPTQTVSISETTPPVTEAPTQDENSIVDETLLTEDIPEIKNNPPIEDIPKVEDNPIIEDIPEDTVEDTGEQNQENAIESTKEETEPDVITPVSDDPNKQLSPDEIAALFAAAEPNPKKEPEVEAMEEEKPFTPTFTVVGKESPKKEIEEPVATTPVSDDPNKQLSPDEIAALFAAADPAPKKAEKPAEPEPVKVEPISEDPNKQLSPDEIAALFAAAEPTPKKEEKTPEPEPVAVTPLSDDPNKQLSPDEIAALFASMG